MTYTPEIKATIDRMRAEDGEPPIDGHPEDPIHALRLGTIEALQGEVTKLRQEGEERDDIIGSLLDDINDMVAALEARESMSEAISIGRAALKREGY